MRKNVTLLLVVLLGFVLAGCHCDRDEENPAGPGGGSNTGDTTRPTMVTPYQYQSEMSSINEAYSETASCPWGFVHLGIDFFPRGDLAGFRAASAGIISRVEKFHNSGNGLWQVNLDLTINSKYRLGYAFEPFSSLEAQADTQLMNIMVNVGQTVAQGQALGRLLARGGGAHVHFSLYRNGTNVCPESYFTPEARDSILALLHRSYPGAFLCY